MLALQVVIVTHLKYLVHFSLESVFASKLISQPMEFNLEPLSTLTRAELSRVGTFGFEIWKELLLLYSRLEGQTLVHGLLIWLTLEQICSESNSLRPGRIEQDYIYLVAKLYARSQKLTKLSYLVDRRQCIAQFTLEAQLYLVHITQLINEATSLRSDRWLHALSKFF